MSNLIELMMRTFPAYERKAMDDALFRKVLPMIWRVARPLERHEHGSGI